MLVPSKVDDSDSEATFDVPRGSPSESATQMQVPSKTTRVGRELPLGDPPNRQQEKPRLLSGLLIHELQGKLHLARSLRLQDMVERRRTDVAVGQPEVGAVQNVKQLSAKLELF